MRAFYGLMLETAKEDRTYQFNAPIGVSFEEVKDVLDKFKSMIIEMDNKQSEEANKSKEDIDNSIEVIEEKESDGTNS